MKKKVLAAMLVAAMTTEHLMMEHRQQTVEALPSQQNRLM